MSTLEVYNLQADKFAEQYLSVQASDVHQAWLDAHLPENGLVLDVGAGVGRDAKYFAERGLEVVAVEPACELRARGKQLTKSCNVRWIDDALPTLSNVDSLQMRFDLIVLSAVWMHIPDSQRERAFRKLTNLLKPGGRLVISLRHGPSPDARVMYPVSLDEIKTYASKFGVVLHTFDQQVDQLQRKEVWWETVVLVLPDDGTGAFPVIRNILINDAKAATYKLALIRTLLRIADGHPGAVVRREDQRVILPLGLVALYWARQYKPLLKAGLQQNSVESKGLAFVKQDGWLQLEHISAQDFSVGQVFLGDDAQAMHKTLKHICTTIKDNPAKFITWSGTNNAIFEAAPHRTPSVVESLYLDFKTLTQYGELAVPISLWESMSQYACWIEPVAVQEWAQVTQRFSQNRNVALHDIMAKLQWIEAERSTTEVRQRVEVLRQKNQDIQCVWSMKALRSDYAIDHCLPFSRWPNNDLWNLLPADTNVNLSKSDKVPSTIQLDYSKEVIIDWWRKAWQNTPDQTRFFSQAQLTLPGLNRSFGFEDVFEAMSIQTTRLVDQQQLRRFELNVSAIQTIPQNPSLFF